MSTTELQREVEEGRYEEVFHLSLAQPKHSRDDVDDARFRELDRVPVEQRPNARPLLNQAANELLRETPEQRAQRHGRVAAKHLNHKRTLAATPYAESAVRLCPRDANLRMINGMVMFELHRLAEAREQFREAAKLGESEAQKILPLLELAVASGMSGGGLSGLSVAAAATSAPAQAKAEPAAEPSEAGAAFWKLVTFGTLAAFLWWLFR